MKIVAIANTDNMEAVKKVIQELKEIEQACGVECTFALNVKTRDLYQKESTL